MALTVVKESQVKQNEPHLHFSYSQLNTYLLCPAKYAHQYVLGTPWETRPVALIFGRAVHRAVEMFYKKLKANGEIIPVDELTAVFEAVFQAEIDSTEVELTFKNGEDLKSIRQQGIELLKIFHSEARPQKIVAVEFPFSVKVPDIINGDGDLPIRLEGVFDMVESDREGNYVVVELKTSGQRFSSLRLEYDLQATVYSYAMAKMKVATNNNSCLVRYDVLLKTKKPEFVQYFVSRTEQDHQRLVHLINQVLKAIENRIFYRQTGWQCGDCQFKKACFS